MAVLAVLCITLMYLTFHQGHYANGQFTVSTNTKYGRVTGRILRDYYVYSGIPYAKPPLGNLRFRPPVSPDVWTTSWTATEPPMECMQILSPGIARNVSEDCLYLNVFTPVLGRDFPKVPVMVWIYGGGFTKGSSWIYDGRELIKKGVIVVTLNYRLDAFGFLSNEESVLPGNIGLLDQIFALRWVKENIVNFGGDPNQVTIFGESAGACSVSILTLSPLARGLFNRAIMESGSVLSPFCVKYSTARFPPKKFAAMLGTKVNCSNGDSTDFLKCMQSVNANDLLLASQEVQLASNSNMILTPRIETTFGVLPDVPSKLLASGQYDHVDTIRGFNSNEAGAIKDNFMEGATRDEFDSFVFKSILGYSALPREGSIVQQFEEIYLKNVQDPITMLQRASEAATDFLYIAPTLQETRVFSGVASEKKHYVYEFNYRRSNSATPAWVAAKHADELFFVFGKFDNFAWGNSVATLDDLLVSDLMITLWTNFAKTGDPNSLDPSGDVHWPAFNTSSTRLLKMNLMPSVGPAGKPEVERLFSSLLSMMDNTVNQAVVG